MTDEAIDLSIIVTVFALISILHVFGRFRNVNKRVENKTQVRRREYEAAALNALREKESYSILGLCPEVT